VGEKKQYIHREDGTGIYIHREDGTIYTERMVQYIQRGWYNIYRERMVQVEWRKEISPRLARQILLRVDFAALPPEMPFELTVELWL